MCAYPSCVRIVLSKDDCPVCLLTGKDLLVHSLRVSVACALTHSLYSVVGNDWSGELNAYLLYILQDCT